MSRLSRDKLRLKQKIKNKKYAEAAHFLLKLDNFKALIFQLSLEMEYTREYVLHP
jgi:hypothetical protein